MQTNANAIYLLCSAGHVER